MSGSALRLGRPAAGARATARASWARRALRVARVVLLALLVAFVVGFVIGTLLRLGLEEPVHYYGLRAQPICAGAHA